MLKHNLHLFYIWLLHVIFAITHRHQNWGCYGTPTFLKLALILFHEILKLTYNGYFRDVELCQWLEIRYREIQFISCPCIFKPGALTTGRCSPGFLKLFLCGHLYVCVRVCLMVVNLKQYCMDCYVPLSNIF